MMPLTTSFAELEEREKKRERAVFAKDHDFVALVVCCDDYRSASFVNWE